MASPAFISATRTRVLATCGRGDMGRAEWQAPKHWLSGWPGGWLGGQSAGWATLLAPQQVCP